MVIVFNVNYQLQYSPSYTGNIHGTCEVQDFNYCVSFANAMQALLGKSYNSFLLTILSTTVGFYCNGYGKFKIFDYHGRDSYGMSHPQGTRVLLEVNTLNELIKNFQGLYQNPNVLSADWYKSLGSAGKQNPLSSRVIWYLSLDTAQKQKRAE